MPFRNNLSRFLPVLLCAVSIPALAASTLTGTVTNRTNGKPSAGDEVVLIRLQQTMQETTHAKTDSKGHFSLEVPEDGMHLVRVTHDKASYFQPVQPGTNNVTMDVYDAAPKIDGVSTAVEELHIEASTGELHVVEVLQVINNSQPARTQFGPAGFDFYVPPAAKIVRAGAQRDGMPVPTSATPVGDPGHYTFLFPIRPGETQFGIFYTLPYVGQQTFDLKLATPVNTAAIVMPKSMTFKAAPATPWQVSRPSAGEQQDPNTQTWVMQSVSLAQPLQFTVTGTGSIPDQRASAQEGAAQGGSSPSGQPLPETQNTAPGRGLQNPLDPEGERDPWGKYKWWILGGLGLLLAAAAGVLLRKPKDEAGRPLPLPDSPYPAPGAPTITQSHRAMIGTQAPSNPLDALKDELFALETDHLQQRISEPEYLEHKAALELVLRRALTRNNPAAAPAASKESAR